MLLLRPFDPPRRTYSALTPRRIFDRASGMPRPIPFLKPFDFAQGERNAPRDGSQIGVGDGGGGVIKLVVARGRLGRRKFSECKRVDLQFL